MLTRRLMTASAQMQGDTSDHASLRLDGTRSLVVGTRLPTRHVARGRLAIANSTISESRRWVPTVHT